MTLGEVIEKLAAMPADKVLTPGFGAPDSYRGYYAEIAFEPVESATAGEMLAHARSADGAMFTGYKGGEFTMDLDTNCHIASYGCAAPDDYSLSPEFFGEEQTAIQARKEGERRYEEMLRRFPFALSPVKSGIAGYGSGFHDGVEWAKRASTQEPS